MLEVVYSFILSFFISYAAIPIVIRLSTKYGIVDKSNARKSHIGAIPSIGGVAIYMSIFLVVMIWVPDPYFLQLRYILSALAIIFIVGAIDDVDPISPLSKLSGQLIGVCLLVFCADIRISQFYGLFGIEMINYSVSVVITLLFFLLVINSFNLIDGINGLASSITILTTTLLGMWFLGTENYAYSIFSFSVSGATLAFLKYNVTPAKIFMGDTGSLVLGAICAILIIQFLEVNQSLSSGPFIFSNAPAVAFGLLIIPIFDTIRVFILRLSNGQSPFVPDKKHVHHLLLDIGLSHMQATYFLLSFNLLMIIFAVKISSLAPVYVMITMMFISYILLGLLQWLPIARKRVLSRTTHQ